MSNKYLEKIALNALVARTMAKEVGILPSSHSAWKYALRNLRDGQGAALQGKALHEGRAKLGDLSNNAYQATKAVDRKVGGHRIEVSNQVGKGGKLVDSMNIGERNRVFSRVSDNLHTHPPVSPVRLKEEERYRSIDPRDRSTFERAGPSGLDDSLHNKRYIRDSLAINKSEVLRGVRKDQLRSDFRDAARSSSVQKSVLRNYAKINPGANRARRGVGDSVESKQISARNILSKVDRILPEEARSFESIRNRTSFSEPPLKARLQDFKTHLKGDFALSKYRIKDPNKLLPEGDMRHAMGETSRRISSPSVDATSAYKLTKNGPRVVYFDHTPRKAKT